jgi:hypothetical protein
MRFLSQNVREYPVEPKFPASSKGRVTDKVGEAFGVSGKTYQKAEAVVAAAEANPIYGTHSYLFSSALYFSCALGGTYWYRPVYGLYLSTHSEDCG